MVRPLSKTNKLESLDVLTDLSSVSGVAMSKLSEKFGGKLDVRSLVGEFQQLVFLRITYNPDLGEEPLIQLTAKGRDYVLDLLLFLQYSSQQS